MTRGVLQPAYVLHQWAWSETSLIVELFSREQGRVTVVAKGAKRPYSQLRSVLLPFQRIMVALGRRKGDDGGPGQQHSTDSSEVFNLRAAEFAGGGVVLPAARLLSAFYLNELTMKLLARQDPHSALFDAYGDVLAALSVVDVGGDEAALRAFELTLLRETGVLPELDRCTTTQSPLQPERGYVLDPASGLVPATTGQPALTALQCETLHGALGRRDMAALRAAAGVALPALKMQLRNVLHYHLGSPHLRTRQAMIEVRRLLDVEPEGMAR